MNIAIANAATLNASELADTLAADMNSTMVLAEGGARWEGEFEASLELTRAVIAARRNGASQAAVRALAAECEAHRAACGIVLV